MRETVPQLFIEFYKYVIDTATTMSMKVTPVERWKVLTAGKTWQQKFGLSENM